jgi:cytoskeletal protein CcmA (bactofilin family)
MALQSPFFNKKDDNLNTRFGNSGNLSANNGSSTNAAPSTSPSALTSSTPVSTGSALKEGESKLTVGPNIKLKGVEITDCDTLVVEGLVEATMDSRVIQISERGEFKGSAEIDIAEIRGEFSGNLTVRQKLVVYSTGKVTGKIRYGKLVVEEGAQLSGELSVGSASSSSKTASQGTLSGLKVAA